jgi:hypothetical protein
MVSTERETLSEGTNPAADGYGLVTAEDGVGGKTNTEKVVASVFHCFSEQPARRDE